jgi:hypothetical protein
VILLGEHEVFPDYVTLGIYDEGELERRGFGIVRVAFAVTRTYRFKLTSFEHIIVLVLLRLDEQILSGHHRRPPGPGPQPSFGSG